MLSATDPPSDWAPSPETSCGNNVERQDTRTGKFRSEGPNREGHTETGVREADHTTTDTETGNPGTLRSIWIIGDGTLWLELDGKARSDSKAVFPYD